MRVQVSETGYSVVDEHGPAQLGDRSPNHMNTYTNGNLRRQLSPQDKSILASDILWRNGIEKPDRPTGQSYQTCPQCSAGAKGWKRQHKVLAININDEGVKWYCLRCKWSGGSGYWGATNPTYQKVRKERDRLRKERKRRSAGAKPRSQSIARLKPWLDDGVSESTWRRREKVKRTGDLRPALLTDSISSATNSLRRVASRID